ncbi:uric acid degradation bifunctional protein TTL-like [Arachis hypogaea]|uniref:Uncharacterized protein n=1 Tax=Arachis hypogaea TaxID=3818 RepID=A0A445CS94_ARAHY|nr:uric acid degradation bifunctional protein TTL-like [Arachis hypogaea]RYR53753.1 hypothetical protein Ahy_A06g028979 [Arachis hypogaea]
MAILSEHVHTSLPQIPQSCSKSSNWIAMEESEFLECCGSIKFAKEMASASPFSSLQHALDVASEVWFNKINIHKINIHSWFSMLTRISLKKHPSIENPTIVLHPLEIYALSMQYLVRFGFPYFKKDSDWDTDVILMDLKMSVKNKPACEFHWACRKQFNIIERHITKFFQKRGYVRSTTESPIIQTAVKDFDLNKKPYPIDDLDPIARDKARQFCEIWYPGEYYI